MRNLFLLGTLLLAFATSALAGHTTLESVKKLDQETTSTTLVNPLPSEGLEIMQALARLPQLNSLTIDTKGIRQSWLAPLATSTSITSLRFLGTFRIRDAGLEHITKMTQLTSLRDKTGLGVYSNKGRRIIERHLINLEVFDYFFQDTSELADTSALLERIEARRIVKASKIPLVVSLREQIESGYKRVPKLLESSEKKFIESQSMKRLAREAELASSKAKRAGNSQLAEQKKSEAHKIYTKTARLDRESKAELKEAAKIEVRRPYLLEKAVAVLHAAEAKKAEKD